MLSIRLPANLDERLGEFAKRMGRSNSSLAEEAILSHIVDIEARYLGRRQVARKRSKKFRKQAPVSE